LFLLQHQFIDDKYYQITGGKEGIGNGNGHGNGNFGKGRSGGMQPPITTPPSIFPSSAPSIFIKFNCSKFFMADFLI